MLLDANEFSEEPGLPIGYQLRGIGQILQERHVVDFVLEALEEGFVVRAETVPPLDQGPVERRGGGLFRRQEPSVSLPPPQPQPLELHFTREDLERLDQEGRSRRQDSSGTADFHGLPQLLRTIGDYLGRQEGKPLLIEKHGTSIRIEYETAYGEKHTEERSASSLYDLSVRMYLRRSER